MGGEWFMRKVGVGLSPKGGEGICCQGSWDAILQVGWKMFDWPILYIMLGAKGNDGRAGAVAEDMDEGVGGEVTMGA